MKGRKVKVFDYKKVNGKSHFEKIYSFDGIFHQFGCNYEEFESGPGNYSTAIIESETGEIKNVPVELVVFVEGDPCTTQ